MLHRIATATVHPVIAASLALALCLAATSPAKALINPDFTPADMVRRANAVLEVEVGQWREGDERLTVHDINTVRGDGPDELVLDTTDLDSRSASSLEEGASKERNKAMVFTGDFSAAAMGGGGAGRQPVAMMHLDVTWFGLYPGDDGRLRVGEDPIDLSTVWAGDQAMLRSVVQYIRTDPRAEVPVVVGAEWDQDELFGEFDGTVYGMKAIEIGGDGKPWLLVMYEHGDRLFVRSDEGSWEDRTEAVGLESRSRHAAAGDFNGSGRVDIATWDGEQLALQLQDEEGQLTASSVEVDETVNDLLGMAVWAAPDAERSGLVLAPAAGGPIVLVPSGDDDFEAITLGSLDEEQAAGPVVVGDFTGDGINDIVQPLADGLALYRGEADGGFASPTHAAEANLGEDINSADVGDFDASGRLDVLVSGRRGTALLINEGDGAFINRMEASGEPSYIARPNTAGAMTLDVNSDGRHDFLLLYENMGMHVYFNRGFRTFGYSISLELGDAMLDGTDAAMNGQVAAAVADFTGDGSTDVALVTADGEGWMLSTVLTDGQPRGVTVAVPEQVKGPVYVSAKEGERSLGARVVRPGKPVYFGKTARGPLNITWRIPGHDAEDERVIALEPQRFIIPAP